MTSSNVQKALRLLYENPMVLKSFNMSIYSLLSIIDVNLTLNERSELIEMIAKTMNPYVGEPEIKVHISLDKL